jgi:hypothetical protein
MHGIVQKALQAQKFKFRQPVIPEDDEDEGANAGGDDNQIDDIANDAFDDDEDIAELVEMGADEMKAGDFENPDNAIIETDINPDEWYRE